MAAASPPRSPIRRLLSSPSQAPPPPLLLHQSAASSRLPSTGRLLSPAPAPWLDDAEEADGGSTPLAAGAPYHVEEAGVAGGWRPWMGPWEVGGDSVPSGRCSNGLRYVQGNRGGGGVLRFSMSCRGGGGRRWLEAMVGRSPATRD